MNPLEPFLVFCDETCALVAKNEMPSEVYRVAISQEPNVAVAAAYREALASLAEQRARTLSYMVPGKDSRGRWMPVYDEGSTDEVAGLAGEIDATKDKIKSIANDIIEVIELSGGMESRHLFVKRSELRDRIKAASDHAANEAQKALRQNPGMALAQVQELPDVKSAYEAMETAKVELEPMLAVLLEKVEKRRAIYEKYE